MDKLINWSFNNNQKDEDMKHPMQPRKSSFVPSKTPSDFEVKPRKASWFEGFNIMSMPTFQPNAMGSSGGSHVPAPVKKSIEKTSSE